MVRVDFDQPTYLRAANGLAIVSYRLNHLLPGDEFETAQSMEPVVINRTYRGAAVAAMPVQEDEQVEHKEIRGELIPYESESHAQSDEAEKAIELNFGGIKGKSATGRFGGSGFAPYRFNKKNGKSFFVRVGKHLIWGIELAPELRRLGVVEGQTISITFMGKQPVMVLKEKMINGKPDSDWVSTHKNLWKVVVLD